MNQCKTVEPIAAAALESDKILHGDVMELYQTIPNDSIPLIVTRPPIWEGSGSAELRTVLGRESHPVEYIQKLILHSLEWKRILTKTGSLYLCLGDAYSERHSLLLLPAAMAIRMSELGWILRNEICWSHRDPLPCPSPINRLPCHESIFVFTKSPRNYYFDHELAKKLGCEFRRKVARRSGNKLPLNPEQSFQ